MLSPHQALKKYFGLSDFRPYQLEVIENILAGTNTLATLPTGSGKSLTFQLPSFLLRQRGTTVVISPLLSLIRDQVQKLQQRGILACQIDSTLTKEQRNHNLKALRNGNIQLLYTSPETLGNPELLDILKAIDISLIAIDEAHCYSEWGHSFRPSYLSLPRLTRAIKPHAVLALTATATRKVASDIRRAFRVKTAHHISCSPKRDNLSYTIIYSENEPRPDKLSNILAKHKHLPAIVYAMRQEQCEAIAHHLSTTGLAVKSYHAGMSTQSRKKIQDDFLEDKIQVIVATIAFGMGVDKPNIRAIIHYHLPKSPEGWLQESGRAGRDAQPAHTYLLACGDDVIPLTNFIRARELSESTIRRLVEKLSTQEKSAVIEPYHTRVNLGLLTSTLDVLLAKLELLKVSTYTHTTWRYIQMNVLYGRKFVLTDYPKPHHKAIEHIMQLGKRERYDLHNAPTDFNIPSEKLYATLLEIKASGECYMRFSGWQKHYKIHKQLDAEQVNTISSTLYEYHQAQLTSDQQRLDEVVRISTTRACIPMQFEKWFSIQKSAHKPCNNCSSCNGEKRPTKLSNKHHTGSELSEEQLETIREFLLKKKKYIHTPAQLTCALCGIGTPYIRHYRIHYHPIFGTFSDYPYDEIHAYSVVLVVS